MARKQKKVTVNCTYCGKEKEVESSYYEESVSKRFFCNNKCKGNWMRENIRGRAHHNWKEKIKVRCAICGKEKVIYPYEYEQSPSKRFYCDYDCSGVWKHEFLKGKNHYSYVERITAYCANCGKPKEIYPSELKEQKNFFCNRKCQAEWLSKNTRGKDHHNWKEKITVHCANCGKPKDIYPYVYRRSTSKIFFCSNGKKCERAWKSEHCRGENSSSWKGGPSTEEEAIRASTEYQEWRYMVFGRDDFTCQMCFRRGVYLHAHHIKEFSKYAELRLAVSNGITLCRECHSSVRGQEEEWIEYFKNKVLAMSSKKH